MNFSNVIDSRIKKNFPIYLLCKEPFFIREILKEFEKILYQKKINLLTRKFFMEKILMLKI